MTAQMPYANASEGVSRCQQGGNSEPDRLSGEVVVVRPGL